MKYIKQFEHLTYSIGPAPLKQLYVSYNSHPIGTLSQNGRFYFDEDYIKENNSIGIPSELILELAELIKKTIV